MFASPRAPDGRSGLRDARLIPPKRTASQPRAPRSRHEDEFRHANHRYVAHVTAGEMRLCVEGDTRVAIGWCTVRCVATAKRETIPIAL